MSCEKESKPSHVAGENDTVIMDAPTFEETAPIVADTANNTVTVDTMTNRTDTTTLKR